MSKHSNRDRRAGSGDVLRELHFLLSAALLNRIKNDVVCDKCERGTMTSGDLTAIRQFLSDNNVVGEQAKPSAPPITGDLPTFDGDEGMIPMFYEGK